MTRGNQREIDRQRAANRNSKGASKKDGDPRARAEADARALQEKVAKKAAARAEEVSSSSGGANGSKSTAKKK